MKHRSLHKYLMVISLLAGSAAVISLLKDIDNEFAWYEACNISIQAELDALHFQLGH